MAQAVGRLDLPLTADVRVRSQAVPCDIYREHSESGTDFSPSTSVFPCQYYSTSAPYSSSCYSYQKDKRPKPHNLPKAMRFWKFVITYSAWYLDMKMWKRRQAAQATQFCMVAPNTCWSSVSNLLPVTLPAPRILGGLGSFRKLEHPADGAWAKFNILYRCQSSKCQKPREVNSTDHYYITCKPKKGHRLKVLQYTVLRTQCMNPEGITEASLS
jgi:hypothetical protein